MKDKKSLTEEELEILKKESIKFFESAMIETIGICCEYIIKSYDQNITAEGIQDIINEVIKKIDGIVMTLHSDTFNMEYRVVIYQITVSNVPNIETNALRDDDSMLSYYDETEYTMSGRYKTILTPYVKIRDEAVDDIKKYISEGRMTYYSFMNRNFESMDVIDVFEKIISTHKAFREDEIIDIDDVCMVINAMNLAWFLANFINEMATKRYQPYSEGKYVVDMFDLMSIKMWFNNSIDRAISSLSILDYKDGMNKMMLMEAAMILSKESIGNGLYAVSSTLPESSLKWITATTITTLS